METDSILVVWETAEANSGEVIYGETDAYDSKATDRRVDTRHAVILRNLEPRTIYHYRVVSNGEPVSEDATFRTAADSSQTGFTFAVLGDTQSVYEAHKGVVGRIAAMSPDFILHVGDLVQNGNSGLEWQAFFDIQRELMARAPLFAALGNHERNNELFFDYFYLPGNERWYVFDYGNARFVCLEVDNIVDYGPESDQYAWLEKTLAANTQPWLIVFFHIPPYSSANDDGEERVRQILVPLIEKHGVDMVFGGHAHNYERNEANGVTYIVTGGGGGSLMEIEDKEPTQAAFALEHHAVLVTVDGDQLRGLAVASDGRVLDEFQRTRR